MEYIADPHEGHRDRLRLRVQDGLDGLEPHETMEWLLCHAIPRQDVNALAHALIDHFGSVENVLMAETAELKAVPGIGGHVLEWIAMLGELMRWARVVQPEDCARIGCCLDLFRYACVIRDEIQPPCTLQLCLDEDGNLIYKRCITPSLAWGEPAMLREATQDMLDSEAKNAVILIYTGNSGFAPEEYDIARAEAYSHVLHAAKCALLDVVFVGEYQFASLRQMGKIPEFPPGQDFNRLREDYNLHMPSSADMRVKDFRDRMLPPEYTRFDDHNNGGLTL